MLTTESCVLFRRLESLSSLCHILERTRFLHPSLGSLKNPLSQHVGTKLPLFQLEPPSSLRPILEPPSYQSEAEASQFPQFSEFCCRV